MKKVALFLMCFMFLSTNLFAGDDRGYINISVNGSGVFIDKDDDLEFDDAFYVFGRVTYDVTSNVEIGIESGFMEYDVNEDITGLDINLGEVSGVPLLGIVILKYPIPATDDKLVPYILGGVGVTFWEFDTSSVLATALPGTSVDDDVAFTWKAGVGADYYITESVAMFVEGSWFSSEYDADVTAPGLGAGSFDVDIEGFIVGGGLKFSI